MSIFVITGAGRGIGLELTRAALASGDTVYGSVRNRADAERLPPCSMALSTSSSTMPA